MDVMAAWEIASLEANGLVVDHGQWTGSRQWSTQVETDVSIALL